MPAAEEEDDADAWTEFDEHERAEPPAERGEADGPEARGGTETRIRQPTPDAAPTTEAPAPAGPSAPASPKRYFEFVGGSSSKFWEVAVDGATITVRFGRIGAKGQVQQKVFAGADAAQLSASRLIREKTGKGYIERAHPEHE